jgi:glycosyltransferase involved in cell wall biosynthesis
MTIMNGAASSTSKNQPGNERAGRKILMLAYVFPPFFSIGGSIRVVKFLKYLPSLGWLPIVLTIDDRHEHDTQRKTGSVTLLNEIPSQVKIVRTRSGEASAELLERGRKIKRENRFVALIIKILSSLRRWGNSLLLPDENIAWLPFALQLGLKTIRKEKVDLLFATCPPHSAAIIGALLSKITGISLVLDFRDDWIDTPWHRAKPWILRRVERTLERWSVRSAERVILVTGMSLAAFQQRYPRQPRTKFVLIPNGCDLNDFRSDRPNERFTSPQAFNIVHAGLLSSTENWVRSPEAFFRTLARLNGSNAGKGYPIIASFTGKLPPVYREMVSEMGLTNVVRETGHLPDEQFLALLRGADLLLVINYDDFDSLIPGKIYEYWAVGGPPILLLSCPGAASSLIEENELGFTVLPYDEAAIGKIMLRIILAHKQGDPFCVNPEGIEMYDRLNLTRMLVTVLDEI